MKLSIIVEGHGEEEAAPILVRRIVTEILQRNIWTLPKALRLSKGTMLHRPEELERHLNIAALEAGEGGTLLILLDADDDCPAELGPKLLETARNLRSDRPIAVVVANREYESWFLAAAESLGLPACENLLVRDAKGWIRKAQGTYRPNPDQEKMTARFDLAVARERADSFDKLCRELERLLPFEGSMGTIESAC
jgi:hypothetical protein